MWTKTKNYILSYNAGSFLKRLLFILLSLVLMNFGIACYFNCGLGSDPFSVFVDGEHALTGLDYGQITNINNIVLFGLMLIFGRKYIHVGTIITALVSGTILNWCDAFVEMHFVADALWEQFLMLGVGLVTFALSVALFIVADMGLSGVAAIPVWFEEKTKINLRWLRIAEDVFFTLVGIILGAIASRPIFELLPSDLSNPPLTGIGTIVGAFGTGPLMKWFINLLIKPCKKWFGPLRKSPPAPEASAEG